MEMTEAQYSDKELIVTTLSQSFRENRSVNKFWSMQKLLEKWDHVIKVLEGIQSGIVLLNEKSTMKQHDSPSEFVYMPFKGAEIYLLHKAFIDAGGATHENYKSLLEKTLRSISNKTQKGFSVQSLCKYSDKVDPESKENVKRFLQKMIRNIDSYD